MEKAIITTLVYVLFFTLGWVAGTLNGMDTYESVRKRFRAQEEDNSNREEDKNTNNPDKTSNIDRLIQDPRN